jgi:MFS family permease
MNADAAGGGRARRDMRLAIRSTCWGAISQVMVKDSSLLIIFAAAIGAGERGSVLTTGLSDLATCLLMLPFAALSDRVGVHRQITAAVAVSIGALLVAAAAPYAGGAAPGVLLAAVATFAVAISAYQAAWFPLLNAIVPPAERGLFFGRLRFAWQLVAACFLATSGWFVGEHATVGRLQLVIVAAALLSVGRIVCIGRIGGKPDTRAPCGFRTSFRMALRDKALTGFGVYLFFLYLAASATLPVAFVFVRNHLRLADNLTVLMSVGAMVGLILGFPLGGRLVHRYPAKWVLLAAHIGFAALNFGLLGIRAPGAVSMAFLMALLALYGVLLSCASVAVSTELFTLAAPNNKAVSIALGWSLYAGGMGLSRLLAAVTLGGGMLTPSWTAFGIELTRYHSLFLLAGGGVLLAMLLLVFIPGMVSRVECLPEV